METLSKGKELEKQLTYISNYVDLTLHIVQISLDIRRISLRHLRNITLRSNTSLPSWDLGIPAQAEA